MAKPIPSPLVLLSRAVDQDGKTIGRTLIEPPWYDYFKARDSIGSFPPSGPAGGVLSGSYPDPGFASTTGTGAVVLADQPTITTGGTFTGAAVETKFNFINTGVGGIAWWFGASNNGSGALGGGKFALWDQTNNRAIWVADQSGQSVGFGGVTAPEANYCVEGPNDATKKFKAQAFDTYSDARLKPKKYRRAIPKAMTVIMAMKPLAMRQYQSCTESGRLLVSKTKYEETIGFVAQDEYPHAPWLVTPGNAKTTWSFNYPKVSVLAIAGLQDHERRIAKLEAALGKALGELDRQKRIVMQLSRAIMSAST